MGVLKDKLLDWNYYFYKIPLYLQESLPSDDPQLGIGGHMKMFFDILVNSDEEGAKIYKAFNITDPLYFENLDLYGVLPNGEEFDFLDKLAELYGLSRNMNVHGFEITLTNLELIQLLEIKIFQINWEGNREEFLKLYDSINIPIEFYLDKNIPGKIFTVLDEDDVSNNIYLLYQYTDLLLINIAGIQYEKYEEEIPENVGIFNTSIFDSGVKFV